MSKEHFGCGWDFKNVACHVSANVRVKCFLLTLMVIKLPPPISSVNLEIFLKIDVGENDDPG
jgi:hypothetical protein